MAVSKKFFAKVVKHGLVITRNYTYISWLICDDQCWDLKIYAVGRKANFEGFCIPVSGNYEHVAYVDQYGVCVDDETVKMNQGLFTIDAIEE